jgi:hypothetical protein
MASIRRKLTENVNGSKNTRMDIATAGKFANYRPDELAHISRYCKIADYVLEEAKRLGRPIDCLEIGCGQIWPLRFLYKALQVTKALQVREYHGYDMDPMVLTDLWQPGLDVTDCKWFQQFNGKVHIQDLTVNPNFGPSSAPDGLFDFFWTTEVIEHMKPEFVEPWLINAKERLRAGGLAYVSTPNHDGSRAKLPLDHIYEWGYEELKALLEKHFELVAVNGVFTQMPNFNKARRADPDQICTDRLLGLIQQRFDPHWQRVILGMFYPKVANNCAWVLRRR